MKICRPLALLGACISSVLMVACMMTPPISYGNRPGGTDISKILDAKTINPDGVGPKTQFMTGTGFFVSTSGDFVTAYHVVRDRTKVMSRIYGDPIWHPARVLAVDIPNDLALLRLESPNPTNPIPFATWNQVPMGYEVFVLGYPLPSIQGADIKITEGIINGEVSLNRQRKLFQMSAEIQKGNSGGPVLSADGLLVGVVQSKLDVLKVYQRTSDIPQNINFALKSYVLLEFLNRENIQIVTKSVDFSVKKRPYDIFNKFAKSVLFVKATKE